MTPQLSRRLGAVFTHAGVTTEERERIVTAARAAEEFGDLPADVRSLVEQIEARPLSFP